MPPGPPDSVRSVANVASVAPVMDSADPVGAFGGPLTVGKRDNDDSIANACSPVVYRLVEGKQRSAKCRLPPAG